MWHSTPCHVSICLSILKNYFVISNPKINPTFHAFVWITLCSWCGDRETCVGQKNVRYPQLWIPGNPYVAVSLYNWGRSWVEGQKGREVMLQVRAEVEGTTKPIFSKNTEASSRPVLIARTDGHTRGISPCSCVPSGFGQTSEPPCAHAQECVCLCMCL